MKSWVNPRWRILTFLVLANAAWIISAWAWMERENWLWITPIALSINFLLLTYDQVLRFSRLEGEPLLGQDPWGLLKIVHQVCTRLQLPEPAVFLVKHSSAHVFSYARSRKHTRIYLTEGALDLLSPKELEAVLTYHMVAVRGSLTVLNYWVGALLDMFYRLGRALENAVAFVFGWSPKIANFFMGPLIGVMRLLLLSREDYVKLDRETARLIDSPEDLASALWKMESYAHTQPWRESWVFAHMCTVSPLNLRVQPPLKGRIKNLVGRYPL